jgi:hypothetical protein
MLTKKGSLLVVGVWIVSQCVNELFCTTGSLQQWNGLLTVVPLKKLMRRLIIGALQAASGRLSVGWKASVQMVLKIPIIPLCYIAYFCFLLHFKGFYICSDGILVITASILSLIGGRQ